MIGFLLKKFFYDLWDNFFSIMILNFGFLISLSLAFVLPPLLPAAISLVLFALLIFWLFLYLCTAAAALGEVSDYRRIRLADLLANIKSAFVPAAFLFTAAALVFFVLRFTVPLYLSMGSLAGTAAAFFSCWLCLFFAGAIQFYPAVYYRLGKRPLKCLKKCAVIFLDNTAFSIFALILNGIMTVLIIPCPCWPLLYLDEALRLRLFKYDWLDAQAAEQNSSRYDPDWRRTKIPWGELLADEREKTGNRSWKSFIFPWKE
ncbi:hypothetical protein AGMMS50230_05470 [Spirochaetia bacterium]|nr:hypothetical protein AGMMS50230_05470 [Spirochaetia bacterium]